MITELKMIDIKIRKNTNIRKIPNIRKKQQNDKSFPYYKKSKTWNIHIK